VIGGRNGDRARNKQGGMLAMLWIAILGGVLIMMG